MTKPLVQVFAPCLFAIFVMSGDVKYLVTRLGEEVRPGCISSAVALYRIGAQAVPALIEALGDSDGFVRRSAAEALDQIGDGDSLPRRVLAERRIHPQERIHTLERLRGAGRATIPTVERYVRQMEDDSNREVAQAAADLLAWIDKPLLGPAAPPATPEDPLLRPAAGTGNGDPDRLLRPSEAPVANRTQGLLKRLFRRDQPRSGGE